TQQPSTWPSVKVTVDGLGTPGKMAVSSDGTLAFEIAGSKAPTNVFYAYRSSTPGGPLAYLGAIQLPSNPNAPSNLALDVAISPDGKWLFVDATDLLCIYQINALGNDLSSMVVLQEQAFFSGNNGALPLEAVAVSPDGKSLAALLPDYLVS